jgi:hypothetical protein
LVSKFVLVVAGVADPGKGEAAQSRSGALAALSFQQERDEGVASTWKLLQMERN